jgi:CRISPR-associated protein Cas1
LSRSNQAASHPVNALVNYAYTLHAARFERALTVVGLDPHCGFLHVADEYRASLAWDLVELVRSEIGGKVLGWVLATRWKRRDFDVSSKGVVSLSEGLARVAAQKVWMAERVIEEVVRWVVGMLAPGEKEATMCLPRPMGEEDA